MLRYLYIHTEIGSNGRASIKSRPRSHKSDFNHAGSPVRGLLFINVQDVYVGATCSGVNPICLNRSH
jgi:hypothetical protein